MKKLRVLDLFSGIGGISLGLERTGGFETVAFCEIEPFPREVLAHHWPEVPIHEDVRTLTRQSVPGDVDIIVGGFPCQPFSVAGQQKGIEDSRHLWPEFARLIREFRPRWVLAENVPGIRTIAADAVIQDLELEGYTAWPLVVGADDVGAPHRRKRVWFVAHCISEGRSDERCGGLLDGEREASGDGADGRGEWPVGDPAVVRRERLPTQPGGACASQDEGRLREPARASAPTRWPARPGEPQYDWEEPRLAYARHEQRRDRAAEVGGAWREAGDGGARSPEQPLGSAAHGLSERLVRRANREALKAYGNSVVPQVVEEIGRAILSVD